MWLPGCQDDGGGGSDCPANLKRQIDLHLEHLGRAGLPMSGRHALRFLFQHVVMESPIGDDHGYEDLLKLRLRGRDTAQVHKFLDSWNGIVPTLNPPLPEPQLHLLFKRHVGRGKTHPGRHGPL